jgi:hypothetical protein
MLVAESVNVEAVYCPTAVNPLANVEPVNSVCS